MDYIGEHLLPGQIGHFFVVVSMVASLTAAFAYFKAVNAPLEDKKGWLKLGRLSFITEAASVLIIFAALFHILYHHLFEYRYAYQHTSLSLEFKYIMSAFWEGQEGSTLLWAFWQSVLGLIVMKREKQWEAPVMSVVSFAQFFLATMIAGIYIFDVKIGSNPFILLRDSGLLDEAPAMHLNFDLLQPIRPDYLTLVTDGNDLNPLLQNYWMVIHPPILFLGFASTLIPYAFAMAGIWTRDFKTWVPRAIPWTLFSIAFLGLGIMMGAKWAYESLNFGGYWAWDPVENASLVPWMIMVSGLHAMCGRAYDPRLMFMWPHSKISVMGGEQAAGVLTSVKEEQMKAKGKEFASADREALTKTILDKYDLEGSAYYSTARLWDDGIIDPVDTRKIIAMGISASLNKKWEETKNGVFRM